MFLLDWLTENPTKSPLASSLIWGGLIALIVSVITLFFIPASAHIPILLLVMGLSCMMGGSVEFMPQTWRIVIVSGRFIFLSGILIVIIGAIDIIGKFSYESKYIDAFRFRTHLLTEIMEATRNDEHSIFNSYACIPKNILHNTTSLHASKNMFNDNSRT